MKARGGRFLLILGAGLAAMAFVVVYLVMSRGSQPSQDNSATVPDAPVMKTIVVAKADIPAYTLLDESNLGLLEVDASTVPVDAVTDPSTLYRKMNSKAVQANHAILAADVTTVGFSNLLAKGEKAFALPVTARNTFADSISEGDHVDVLWSVSLKVSVPYQTGDGKIAYEKDVYTTTKTLLQDVKVLRVTSLRAVVPTQSAPDGTPQAANTSAPQVNLSTLYTDDAPYSAVYLLAVNDQAAEVLKYTMENGGTLDLTLRSSAALKNADGTPVKDASNKEVRGDHDVEKTTGITIDELIKSYGLTTPPAQWGPAATP